MTKLNPHLNIYEASYDNLSREPFIWGEKIRKNRKFLTKDKKAGNTERSGRSFYI